MTGMKEVRLARVAHVGLRLALGTAFLSAVAGRFGIWHMFGHLGGGWDAFVTYVCGICRANQLVPSKGTRPSNRDCRNDLRDNLWLLLGVRDQSVLGCVWQRRFTDVICASDGVWRP